MPYPMWNQSYGKGKVRVTKVDRDGDVHHLTELTVNVELDGDFRAAYADADNSIVIPTDTMKNTIYAYARELDVRELETFAWTLGCHFVEDFEHVTQAVVNVSERSWKRLAVDGQAHPHAFVDGGSEKQTVQAVVVKPSEGEDEPDGAVQSGLTDLAVLKTTASGFKDFLHDEFTTLKDADDRIFATTITATWNYNAEPDDWRAIRTRIRDILLREFSARFSPSVQATLYEMCQAVLDAEPVIDEITLSMPNQHRLLVDLSPFGMDNQNVIFMPTDEPHGVISAGFCREHDHDDHEDEA